MKSAIALSLLACLLVPRAEASAPEDVPMYAVSLVGTPYRAGGAAPDSGLDCSGFVGHVYLQTTGLQLPRESRALSESTEPLAEDALEPGDLVFFNTLDRPYSHVGIYVGDGRFVHASSARTGTVMLSRLADRYWRERYDGARRVPVPGAPQAALAVLR